MGTRVGVWRPDDTIDIESALLITQRAALRRLQQTHAPSIMALYQYYLSSLIQVTNEMR